ncbi:MAG: MaoC family dehydratase N-terminal domain-containing protein [Rhizobiaceae bacterium]
MQTDYQDWIGRTQTGRDIVSADKATRLAATLDHDRPPYANGAEVPPLIHWLHFLPTERQSQLGVDGHPARGGFLPPVDHLPRRMWAGSRITFPAPLVAGMKIERRSVIRSIAEKQSGVGPLVFVTVRHEISEVGGGLLVTDEHDIVYRGLSGAAARPAPDAGPAGEIGRSLAPDAVMLFRYSALTFNGHRIHYDRPYAVEEEGYPGLVVHGPLTATLLLDLVGRTHPRRRIAAYEFRAVSPLFDGNEIHLNGSAIADDGSIDLWAANADGGLAMKARARLEP